MGGREIRSGAVDHRVAGGEVRGARQGIFTALAVRYGVVDLYGSVWAPGCFDASLNQRLPVILFGHDHVEPVGRATSWRPTPNGPEVTAKLDLSADVPKGRQAAAQLQSGTITDVSVGFTAGRKREPSGEERKRWPGVREVIDEAEMLELSLVSVGAVPGAKVLSSRSASLARDLATGRISVAQYQAEVDLEAEMDEALARVAPLLRAERLQERAPQADAPAVAKWIAVAEAKEAARQAAEQAAAERARADVEAARAHAQRRQDDPFGWL